jgi:hypothetical protein
MNKQESFPYCLWDWFDFDWISLEYVRNFLGRGGGGGGYGFRRQNDGDVQILTDAIFIQNLPKNITREEIVDAFSTVGPIKVD